MASLKRHVMTAKRRAALKKAQLASARKRRRHGRAIAKGKYKAYKTRRKAQVKRLYRQPGGYARMQSDRYHSRNAFAYNWKGKPYSKGWKRANKVGQTALALEGGPIYAATYGISKYRGKKAAARRKRRR